jgi:acyl-CoA reductase-like NAD-dependent aldehyde dehydrogenase
MATTTEEIEVRSTYSGEVVGRVPKSDADDAERAVDAAAQALESPLPTHERAAILDRVAGFLRERHEEMAQTICAEAGKPIKTARVEASRAVSTYTFAAVEARSSPETSSRWEPPRPARARSRSRCAARSA